MRSKILNNEGMAGSCQNCDYYNEVGCQNPTYCQTPLQEAGLDECENHYPESKSALSVGVWYLIGLILGVSSVGAAFDWLITQCELCGWLAVLALLVGLFYFALKIARNG